MLHGCLAIKTSLPFRMHSSVGRPGHRAMQEGPRGSLITHHEGQDMNSKAPKLDLAFLEGQRRRLVELREQLEKTIQTARARESSVNGQSLREAQEYEDDAQRLALLEVDGT